MAEQLGERWELRNNPSPLETGHIDPAPLPFDSPFQIEVEERLARIERKQDALYAEIHAVSLKFDEMVTGVIGAVQSNPLLSRLFGGRK
jgi:hypothetical protein